MKLTPRERLKGLPVNRMIPNALTLGAVCAGLTAIRFALDARWEMAALAILVAAILDGLDGRVARILKGSSKFGAELDSLSDFVSFGVAPPLTLYLWALQDTGRFGWALVLFFAICAALRLARFNVDTEGEATAPGWTRNYFTGVPSPAAAGLVMLPLILSQLVGDTPFRRPEIVAVLLVLVGALMVSTIPTYSFKKFRIQPKWILPLMLFVGVTAALLITAPWGAMALILILYMLSIPFSVRTHAVLRKRDAEAAAQADGTETEETPAQLAPPEEAREAEEAKQG